MKIRKGQRERHEIMASDDRKQVLHMKKGVGKSSYAVASYVQKQALSLTKSIKEEALEEFYSKQQPSVLRIADLGCSSAADNSLHVITELIETVEKTRRELGHAPPEYVVYLNDLPGNDFNTLFSSLASFQDNLKRKMGDEFGHCFVHGVPHSFYKRLFPNKSLHFVHSSSSLQWLSQEPEGIEDSKENIYIAKTSPPTVVQAYFEQFQKDFSNFLRCRSKELVEGGKMVLTILGRTSSEPYSRECCYVWDLLTKVLTDMVLEGFIKEKDLKGFNIPIYYPSPSELEFLVEKDGSYNLNKIHVAEVNWKADDYENNLSKSCDKYDIVTCMRSVAEPLLIRQFGTLIIDEMFRRYQKLVHSLPVEMTNAFINVTLLLTRKE